MTNDSTHDNLYGPVTPVGEAEKLVAALSEHDSECPVRLPACELGCDPDPFEPLGLDLRGMSAQTLLELLLKGRRADDTIANAVIGWIMLNGGWCLHYGNGIYRMVLEPFSVTFLPEPGWLCSRALHKTHLLAIKRVATEEPREPMLDEHAFATATFLYMLGLTGDGAPGEVITLDKRGNPEGRYLDPSMPAMRKGVLYLTGCSVPTNLEAAIHCFIRAATRGDSLGLAAIGLAHDMGLHLPINPAQAAVCYRRSAQAGCPHGMALLASAFLRGHAPSESIARCIIWLNKAADAGSIFAMHQLAECHRDGIGVPPSEELYLHWLTKALRTPTH